ncbi:MAG: hypothetical protein K9H25_05400 [Rhodospirillum sp.]|nr:hypothetical protein [Rhodospirillum sp.]MCF8488924.1 hypothetical protein [Rhodospirillum sp.]MCF8498980.1 hypothetical protein [Rhodospirillum sp.]
MASGSTGAPFRTRAVFWVAVLLLAPVLAACEGGMDMIGGSTVRVERIHTLPANPPPTPFVINALTRGQTADPVFQAAADIVGALLEREGHPRLDADKAYAAPWKVTLETAMTPRPAGQATAGASAEQVDKRLTLTIRDNGRTVYQGRAALVDRNRDLAGSVGTLARALFQEFPGPQGVKGGTALLSPSSDRTAP